MESFRATFGALGQYYFEVDQSASQPGAGLRISDRHRYFSFALFGDGELKLAKVAAVIGGARYDQYETFGERVSPRTALILTPLGGTTLKLIFGEAFRAPSIYELYYEDGSTQAANPDLDPEVLRHFEAVIEQELPGGWARASASVFHYDMFDLITPVTDPVSGLDRFENLEKAEADGFELGLDGRLPWYGLRGALGYTFSHVVDVASGKRLSNSPEHVAQFRLSLPLYEDRVFIACAARYLGERPTVLTGRHLDSAFLFDVTLTCDDLIPGLDLGVGLTNLFDERWSVPGGTEHLQDAIEQDGRAAWVRLSYSF